MEIFKYRYDDLFNPALQAIHALGGSASVSEIEEEVSKILNLSEDEINEIHRGSITKLSYRLAWARNYIKRFGLLENSSRGVWSLTPKGLKVTSVDKEKVKREVKKASQQRKPAEAEETEEEPTSEIFKLTWQGDLLEVLQSMPADRFERLCQRMLRELGFINVEVTGRSGDGGVDGKGVLRLGGVLSFPVVFQCKKYKGSISPSLVRDFRGSMIGRADKGLFFTTGTFSREAIREAQRAGAPPIDLMDGYQFADTLRNLELGVEVEVHKVEEVKINKHWFDSI